MLTLEFVRNLNHQLKHELAQLTHLKYLTFKILNNLGGQNISGVRLKTYSSVNSRPYTSTTIGNLNFFF